MATLIDDQVRADPAFTLIGRLSTSRQSNGANRASILASLGSISEKDVVIVDFTNREQTRALLDQAIQIPCSLVIGTSGLGEEEMRRVRETAQVRAILVAPNFSIGIAHIGKMIRALASGVGATWNASVLDIHFQGKVDSPSATARHLAEQWDAASRAETRSTVASFRIGNGVSEHRVFVAGADEQIEVVHRVTERRAFVPGVLTAIRFVHRAGPGLYGLEDLS
jgi:4-hydroxy-tetrahydrodipicolinate reductase